MADYTVCGDPNRRHDFILIFDVTDGNPNGDPDAGNLPRIDPETMQGLVTDVCLKRKIRNYVMLATGGEEGYDIYVNDRGVALNTLHEEAYTEAKIKSTGSKQKREDIDSVRTIMCRRFFDVRSFGAVMTTGKNAGQVRGPFQLTFARSVDAIVPLDETITRVAITKSEDANIVTAEEGGDGKSSGKTTEMGRKAIVPYGLYIAHGFFTPAFAKQTGVSRDDLELFWKAVTMMFDLDHSAARGKMSVRGLHVFSHDDPLGNAPSHVLFDKLEKPQRRNEDGVPRRFDDYVVKLNREVPEGVTLTSLVG